MGIFDNIFNNKSNGNKISKDRKKEGPGSIKYVNKFDEEKKDYLGKGCSGVKLENVGDKKINVIKILREYIHFGLKEAKELAEDAPCIAAENISYEGAENFAHPVSGWPRRGAAKTTAAPKRVS